jgi:nicotinate phosphoribosyltransferase
MMKSLLDTDAYKLTMGQAALRLFPEAKVAYSFFNRGGDTFSDEFAKELKSMVSAFSETRLTGTEAGWLRTKMPYLTDAYIDFWAGYRFDPSEVNISIIDGNLRVGIDGYWYRTIYWEVPLMAAISELYFKMNGCQSTECHALEKAEKIRSSGAVFADFGTRRRFSFDNHERVVSALKGNSAFIGTSNAYLAMQEGLKPIGTMAHEWFQFHEAKHGIRSCTREALENWVKVYNGDLGIALTDTFTTPLFLRTFDKKYAKLFDGVRQDSGSPEEFADMIIAHYENLGIDPTTKTIIFSDGLNADRVCEIEKHVNGRTKTAYGIGTNLTNDVGVKPLNIVIKMVECAHDGDYWVNAAKLSDDIGKNTGDRGKVASLRREVDGY